MSWVTDEVVGGAVRERERMRSGSGEGRRKELLLRSLGVRLSEGWWKSSSMLYVCLSEMWGGVVMR